MTTEQTLMRFNTLVIVDAPAPTFTLLMRQPFENKKYASEQKQNKDASRNMKVVAPILTETFKSIVKTSAKSKSQQTIGKTQ